MMNIEMEEKIRMEIIRRAVERSYLQHQRNQEELHTQDILDALEQLTGLPRFELDNIARDVRGCYIHDQDTFFSIKNQVVFGSILMLALVGIPFLTVWLF